MQQLLRNLSNQDLLDRLARLTEYLGESRGLNVSYEFCKMDMEEIQQEIEYRRHTNSWHTENESRVST
jgi:hypothetical protein